MLSYTTMRVMNFHSPKNYLHNIVFLWLLNILRFGLSHIPMFSSTTIEIYEFSLPKKSFHNIVFLLLLNILKFGLSHIPGFSYTTLVSYEFSLTQIAFEHSEVWTFPHSDAFLYNNEGYEFSLSLKLSS